MHAELVSHLASGEFGVREHRSGHLDLLGRECARATERLATSSGSIEAGSGAFSNHVALELGQCGENVQRELAGGRCGVDRFSQGSEADLPLAQGANGIYEVSKRSPEPIEFPDDDHIASSREVQQSLASWEDRGHPRYLFAKNLLAAGRFQRVSLEPEVLILGGDTSVPNEHERTFPCGYSVAETYPPLQYATQIFATVFCDTLIGFCQRDRVYGWTVAKSTVFAAISS